jgi:hypothetical protein
MGERTACSILSHDPIHVKGTGGGCEGDETNETVRNGFFTAVEEIATPEINVVSRHVVNAIRR